MFEFLCCSETRLIMKACEGDYILSNWKIKDVLNLDAKKILSLLTNATSFNEK